MRWGQPNVSVSDFSCSDSSCSDSSGSDSSESYSSSSEVSSSSSGDGYEECIYQYDALTRRVKTTALGETRDIYFNRQWRAIEERVADAVKAQHIWNPADRWDLLCRKRSVSGLLDETRYVLRDYLDPVAIINESGTVTERYRYDAFGPVTILAPDFSERATSECAWTFLYHAEFQDTITGLYNYGYRWYDAITGRWINRDPIEEKGGINLYGFARNNCLNNIDILGNASLPYFKIEFIGTYQGPQGCFGCNHGQVYRQYIANWFNAKIAQQYQSDIGFQDNLYYDVSIRGYKITILNWKTVSKDDCSSCRRWIKKEKASIRSMWFKPYAGTRQEIIDALKKRWGKAFKEEQVPEEYPDVTPPPKAGVWGIPYQQGLRPRGWDEKDEFNGNHKNYKNYAREKQYDLSDWVDGDCVSEEDKKLIESGALIVGWSDE